MDNLTLLEYKANATARLNNIDATESVVHEITIRFKNFFNNSEVDSLKTIYKILYPESDLRHVYTNGS